MREVTEYLAVHADREGWRATAPWALMSTAWACCRASKRNPVMAGSHAALSDLKEASTVPVCIGELIGMPRQHANGVWCGSHFIMGIKVKLLFFQNICSTKLKKTPKIFRLRRTKTMRYARRGNLTTLSLTITPVGPEG